MFGKKCPHCGTSGTTEMRVLGEYAHFYWIPIFPLSKKGVSQCQHCKQKLEYKDMPSAFQMEYEAMRSEVKTPVWQFVGLGVFACVIALAVYQSKEGDKNDLIFLNSPQVGDLYQIKSAPGNYTLLRVAAVHGDTIGVNNNAMEVSKLSGLHRIDEPQNFYELVEPMLKSDLLEMHKNGDLIGVKR